MLDAQIIFNSDTVLYSTVRAVMMTRPLVLYCTPYNTNPHSTVRS